MIRFAFSLIFVISFFFLYENQIYVKKNKKNKYFNVFVLDTC